MTIEEKIKLYKENLDIFDDGMDKYKFLIDQAKNAKKFPEEYRNETFKVTGCQAQVWLVPLNDNKKLSFYYDSDAFISKGMITILCDIYGNRDPKEIQNSNSNSRVVMLTGYGNIPTAVAAIKQGAIDYLAKPADADDVEKALLANPNKKAEPPENPMSADRVKWEHIHRVFELCNRNVSETARRLKMHRRTLQRILSKRSPR